MSAEQNAIPTFSISFKALLFRHDESLNSMSALLSIPIYFRSSVVRFYFRDYI